MIGLRSKTLGRRGSLVGLIYWISKMHSILEQSQKCAQVWFQLFQSILRLWNLTAHFWNEFGAWLKGLVYTINGVIFIILFIFIYSLSLLWLCKKRKKSTPPKSENPHNTWSRLNSPSSWIQQFSFHVEWSCSSLSGFSCQQCLQSLSPSDRGTALLLLYTQTSLGCHRTADPREGVVMGLFKWFSHKWKVALLGRPSKLHKCIAV